MLPHVPPRRTASTLSVLAAGSALLFVAATAQAQAAGPSVPAKFANLRFEENWTGLAVEDATTNHRWPGIKHQDLGGGWTASYGGQFRYRVHFEQNKNLMDTSPVHNNFSLYRTRIHVDVRHVEDGWRVFAEGLDARISGESRPPTGIDRNDLDIQNLFVEKNWDGGAVRLGRMELQEGAQRLVSPLEWGNTRRTFEGGLLRLDHGGATTDIFATRPVVIDVHADDDPNDSASFSGVYHSRKTDGGLLVDVFGLVSDETDPLFTGGDGDMGDRQVYTVGGRLAGKHEQTDYELWAATQFGEQANNDIDAYAWELRMGQTFPDCEMQPRVGLDILYASGDGDPTDDETGTFNQLFPLGHAFLGYIDLVGRQNIVDVSPSITAKTSDRTEARLAWHKFRLAEDEDALYNAGGAPTFVDTSGASSGDVGDELDLTLGWRPEFLDPHSHVLFGFSRFFAGQRMDDLGGSEDATLFYMQYTLTF